MDNVKPFNDTENRTNHELPGADNPSMADDSDYSTSDAFLRIDSDYEVPPTVNATPPSSRSRPLQRGRFAAGLLFATGGILLMLIVAVGALQSAGADGRLSLPVVALCMIIGLMLLGGGFGVMATAVPTFDDDEFDRLVQAGNIPLPNRMSDADESPAPRVWTDDAAPTRTEQRKPQEQSTA